MIAFEEVTAVALAGGRSSRMGRDKAWIEIAGAPLVEHVIVGLRAMFSRVIISVRPDAAAPFGRFGLPIVADREPAWGSLAGIDAALAACETDWLFALACDMPLVDRRAVAHLLEKAGPEWEAVIPHAHGFHQPLHGLYHRAALGHLDARRGGDYSLHAFLGETRALHVPEEDMMRVVPGLGCFLQANRPDELEILRLLLEGRVAED